jgi:hypothetical protein
MLRAALIGTHRKKKRRIRAAYVLASATPHRTRSLTRGIISARCFGQPLWLVYLVFHSAQYGLSSQLMLALSVLAAFLGTAHGVDAVALAGPPQFTIYTPHDPNVMWPLPSMATATSDAVATYTVAAANSPKTLSPPEPPSPPIQTAFPVQLSTGSMPGLSIPQSGSFAGFSIEMSLAAAISM